MVLLQNSLIKPRRPSECVEVGFAISKNSSLYYSPGANFVLIYVLVSMCFPGQLVVLFVVGF